MSKSVNMLLAGAAIIAMSASAFARGGEDCGYGEHGPMMDMSSERMGKMHEQHFAKLHDKLKLTAKQEGAWQKFAASEPMRGKLDRPNPADMEKLNAPQRMEKALEHMRAMEKRMAEHLAAMEEFYAALTPAQQKTFDDQMPNPGKRGQRRGR